MFYLQISMELLELEASVLSCHKCQAPQAVMSRIGRCDMLPVLQLERHCLPAVAFQ